VPKGTLGEADDVLGAKRQVFVTVLVGYWYRANAFPEDEKVAR